MADNLDLRTSTSRAKVNFDCGTFDIRHPRELAFPEMGKVIALGKNLDELSGDIDDPAVLKKCQQAMQALTRIVLFGKISKADLDTLTPDDMQSLLSFFNALRTRTGETDPSESASSSSPGANDSTEAEEKG